MSHLFLIEGWSRKKETINNSIAPPRTVGPLGKCPVCQMTSAALCVSVLLALPAGAIPLCHVSVSAPSLPPLSRFKMVSPALNGMGTLLDDPSPPSF